MWGTLATAPIIAAATMEGSCAAGCPYGLDYDPYPGQCSRYIDLDGSGSCDLALSAASNTQNSSADSDNDTINPVDDNGLEVSDTGPDALEGANEGSNFHILPVTIIIIGSYLFTYYLFKKRILKPKQHKRIWNILVTIGYIGTGLTGVLLTLMIKLGISTAYNSGITYWHAELALLMVLGTFIHLHIYRKPLKKMFKVFNINLTKKG
ncbi:hypothetical protein HYG87_00455 [Methanobacterium alkalithermotolerans]|uniref:DUF4405 domain-containing protein n=1 Tax=Methanobacterium alkalithermotolerans TaxID=2731220 RepID=A0A8T8K9H6_9EURY|nr:hypothetical protein HYG87_00455 [Methanobacterium alkalithermotolerans]